jgi:hypothetical protein
VIAPIGPAKSLHSPRALATIAPTESRLKAACNRSYSATVHGCVVLGSLSMSGCQSCGSASKTSQPFMYSTGALPASAAPDRCAVRAYCIASRSDVSTIRVSPVWSLSNRGARCLHVTYWSPYSRSQKLQPHAAAGQPVSARSPVSTIGVRESQAVP